MSILKKFLKYWLTLSSVGGFLLGWIFVSQSSEDTLASAAAVNTGGTAQSITVNLPPVTMLNSLIGNNPQQVTEVKPFTIVQSTQFQPQMRTGGS